MPGAWAFQRGGGEGAASTRQRILDAAGELFRAKGFDATTTRDIAAAAGMQSGSPFYHFKSKDALYPTWRACRQNFGTLCIKCQATWHFDVHRNLYFFR